MALSDSSRTPVIMVACDTIPFKLMLEMEAALKEAKSAVDLAQIVVASEPIQKPELHDVLELVAIDRPYNLSSIEIYAPEELPLENPTPTGPPIKHVGKHLRNLYKGTKSSRR